MDIHTNKYAIYIRVSTAEQSTENQKLRLVEIAKMKGWQFDIFEEVESSRKSRPIKADLMQRARNGEYLGIFVYKLDRFARSSTELILDIKELLDKGIQFISYSDNLDFGTASGKLHFQILAAFAEFERELIRERTKEGLRRKKQQGIKLGRPVGSRDSKQRKKGGYLLREAEKRKKKDTSNGIYKSLVEYTK